MVLVSHLSLQQVPKLYLTVDTTVNIWHMCMCGMTPLGSHHRCEKGFFPYTLGGGRFHIPLALRRASVLSEKQKRVVIAIFSYSEAWGTLQRIHWFPTPPGKDAAAKSLLLFFLKLSQECKHVVAFTLSLQELTSIPKFPENSLAFQTIKTALNSIRAVQEDWVTSVEAMCRTFICCSLILQLNFGSI